MSTRHQLPVGAEQLSAQLCNPPTPPSVPCRTYRSTACADVESEKSGDERDSSSHYSSSYDTEVEINSLESLPSKPSSDLKRWMPGTSTSQSKYQKLTQKHSMEKLSIDKTEIPVCA